MGVLPVGKLPPDLLAELIPSLPGGPRVVLGPRLGEDAAVLDMGDHYLVAKTDPITFATDEIGWYAVQVNANDIATTGAIPLWFLATILLPDACATAGMARDILSQIAGACRDLDIAVVGGHTEITHDLDRPIVVGCLLGEVAKDRLVRTGGARPGDVILLTKGAPIEATAIIAREKRAELEGRFTASFLDRCANSLHDPGISVVREARLAVEVGGVTSMHDPTEGGVVTALWELADACGCGIEVDLFGDESPWLQDGEALCKAFTLDPARAIASGALLVTVAPDRLERLLAAYHRAQIPVYRLGRVGSGDPAVRDSQRGELLRPVRDEIARLFE
ncbi:MAG TPA: AIR synthase family protein [Aggregatilineaceae bacterium]|nr:AIR synthase family protein [Aggregatilineaceae bacterium]